MIDYNKIPSPCYVVDEGRLNRNLRLISSVAKQAGIDILISFKAFAGWSLFPLIKKYTAGASASSLNEARLCFEEMGMPAHTYSPVFKEDEFDGIISYSSHITFNSISQFQRFYPVIKQSGRKISSGLRINPEYSEIEQGLYNPCSPGSRLGITSDAVSGGLPEGVEGLHFHVLFESDSIALVNMLDVVGKKFGHLFPGLKWLNMGGGLLITGRDFDTGHMVKVLRDFRQRTGLQIILEPGSAFLWETGELVTTVQDVVVSQGVKTAIIDASFTAHMPDCLEMPYKPAIFGAGEPGDHQHLYRIGGNSCLSGDYMGDWSFRNGLKRGDRIVFLDMIHYTMVKSTMFNGVSHPSLALWKEDGTLLMLREFGYEDYRSRLS